MKNLLKNLNKERLILELRKQDYFLASLCINRGKGIESDSPLPFEAGFVSLLTPEFIAKFNQQVDTLITSGIFDSVFDVSYYPELNPADIEAAMHNLSALLAEPFGMDWAITHKEEIRAMVAGIYEASAIVAAKMSGIANPANFVFDLVDQKAVDQLQNMGIIWINEGTQKKIITGVTTSLARTALEQGLSTEAAGELFKNGLSKVAELKSDIYYQNLASIVLNRARNISRIYQYQKIGVQSAEWLAIPDNRVCSICENLDGTVWSVGDLVGVADRMVNAATPEEFITVSPFVNSLDVENNEFVLATGERVSTSASSDILAKMGITCPAHPGCRCQLIVWTG